MKTGEGAPSSERKRIPVLALSAEVEVLISRKQEGT